MTAPAFDEPASLLINRARDGHLRRVVKGLQAGGVFRSAADIGCGYGYFTGTLLELGLEVTAIDGRAENVAEAKQRHPSAHFEVFDVEDPALGRHAPFEIVVCFGLLYHLENPLAAIRNLAALTRGVCLVESVCAPITAPSAVLYEEEEDIDQGLDYLALIPSESLIVKALYRNGFTHVYRPAGWPDHADFQTSLAKRRRRTLLIAGKGQGPIELDQLEVVAEPRTRKHIWDRSGRLLESPRIRSALKAPLRR